MTSDFKNSQYQMKAGVNRASAFIMVLKSNPMKEEELHPVSFLWVSACPVWYTCSWYTSQLALF